MAKYWVYIEGQVQGPYTVDQLIKLRGFSRQTMVCAEGSTPGEKTEWISPAQIPQLANLFRAADQLHEETKEPTPKPIPKPAKPLASKTVVTAPPHTPWPWKKIVSGLLGVGLVGGFLGTWQMRQMHQRLLDEQLSAQALVAHYRLPSSSAYNTLEAYWMSHQLEPRWECTKTPMGLWQVGVSWSQPHSHVMPVYLFEANLQAQALRGLNSAAQNLMQTGIQTPSSPAAAAAPHPASLKTVAENRVKAISQGDYATAWTLFSTRRRTEMQAAGMSESSYSRLEQMKHLNQPIEQDIQTITEHGAQGALVTVLQHQNGHADVLIGQHWIQEKGAWKLDDERQKSTATDAHRTAGSDGNSPPPKNETAGSSEKNSSQPQTNRSAILALPGLSSEH